MSARSQLAPSVSTQLPVSSILSTAPCMSAESSSMPFRYSVPPERPKGAVSWSSLLSFAGVSPLQSTQRKECAARREFS